MIVIGGLDQRDGEIRGEDTSWNLGEEAARGWDGKGQGCFSGVLVLEGRFRACFVQVDSIMHTIFHW